MIASGTGERQIGRGLGVLAVPLLLLAPLSASTTRSSLTAGRGSETLAIRDVWLWDGRSSTVRPHATVLIRNGRIVEVGANADVVIPEGAREIEGRSLYLIPGLWDMHVHALWAEGVPESFLPLFIAHGVTGVRDMGGTLEILEETRSALRSGELLGPRLVAAGMILDGPVPIHPEVSIAVGTREEARAAVATLAGEGVDFVKVYTLLPETAFEGVIEEAAKRSLPVAGHVPFEVGPIAAARADMATVEHAMTEVGGFCSPEEPQACEPIFETFRRHGTWQVPCLVIERKQSRAQVAGCAER